MIDNLHDFHSYVGETIMFCQCIEQDIKFIYAGMLEGDFDGNYEDIEKWTLGRTVKNCKNWTTLITNLIFTKMITIFSNK